MARAGRVYLVGDGSTRANPVHGADLAAACADALDAAAAQIEVGGPDVMSWEQIARLAFETLGKDPAITHAYAVFANATREQLSGESVTGAQFIALVILGEFPEGLTQTKWGEYQGVTRQRAHTISGALVSAQLINIKPSGRATEITLARAGKALVRRLRPRVSQQMAHCLDRLSTQEARELSRLLAKLF